MGLYPMEPATDTRSGGVPGVTTAQDWECENGERTVSPSCTSTSSGTGSPILQAETQVETNPDMNPRDDGVVRDLIDWEEPVVEDGHGGTNGEELRAGRMEAIKWVQFCNTATNQDDDPIC